MEAIFIYNNLKVDTFNLKDEPYPGFELLTWEHESFIPGTLWDIGNDAGYTEIGIDNVSGQIWLTESFSRIEELQSFCGYPTLTYKKKIKAYIKTQDLIQEELNVSVFVLKQINLCYNRITDGKWFIKRNI